MDVKELTKLLYEASQGKDDFNKGIVGVEGFGFVFRNYEDISHLISEIQTMRNIINLDRIIENKFSMRYDRATVYIAALKTLIPNIQLAGGVEELFNVWAFMLYKDKIYPFNFYFGVSGTFLDFRKTEEFPGSIFTKEEENEVILAFKGIFDKVPKSHFECIYYHDLGPIRIGFDDLGTVVEEIDD